MAQIKPRMLLTVSHNVFVGFFKLLFTVFLLRITNWGYWLCLQVLQVFQSSKYDYEELTTTNT